jgi:hypothetical protein
MNNNFALEFRFLENYELSLKISGKEGRQSIFSHNNYQSSYRGLTYEDIMKLPMVPSFPLKYNELSILNKSSFEKCYNKNMFFPTKTTKGYYNKGMDPNDYEYVWGIKYKGIDNDNFWYKACFLHVSENKFSFLTSTDNFLEGNSLKHSLCEGWYVCKNGTIAPALFWSCIIEIIVSKYNKFN